MLGSSVCISPWGAGSPFTGEHSGLLLAVQLHNSFWTVWGTSVSWMRQAGAWAAAEQCHKGTQLEQAGCCHPSIAAKHGMHKDPSTVPKHSPNTTPQH